MEWNYKRSLVALGRSLQSTQVLRASSVPHKRKTPKVSLNERRRDARFTETMAALTSFRKPWMIWTIWHPSALQLSAEVFLCLWEGQATAAWERHGALVIYNKSFRLGVSLQRKTWKEEKDLVFLLGLVQLLDGLQNIVQFIFYFILIWTFLSETK